jgi:predicted TIM-barrel fold metal-dependent hydrolase
LADIDASLAELERVLDRSQFDGVCLQTNTNGVYLGDPRFEPLFAELNKRRTVAFVHPVSPKFLPNTGLPFNGALLEFMFDSARAITSLIYSGMRRRYPDFTYIATHGGGVMPYLADRIASTNILVMGGYEVPTTAEEVLRDLRSLIYDLTASTSDTTLASLTELVPASNLVMGFDFPMMSAQRIAPSINNIRKTYLISDRDLPMIARQNALRILPRLSGRIS